MKFVDLEPQSQRIQEPLQERLETIWAHGQHLHSPEVMELEQRLSSYVGGVEVVTCGSGTDALVLALRCLGVGHGDAVFVPALSFTATAAAVRLVGAQPIFVDISADTGAMCSLSLRAVALHSRQVGQLRLVAAIAVDLFGHPADYESLLPVCSEAGLALLIDGAQSFGASYGGKRLGAYGPLSTTSFFPSKPLGTYGDGGAIFCADSAQARTLRELRDHGRTTEGKVVAVGMNSRLAAIQAAVLLEKLAIFDDELARRRQVAARYRQLLGDSVVVVVPRGPSAESAWALLPVLLPHEFGDLTQEGTSRRSGLLLELISSGVPARLYYETPLHAYAFFGHSGPELPAAESLAKRLLFLPFHPYLSADDQERVVAELRVALGRRVP